MILKRPTVLGAVSRRAIRLGSAGWIAGPGGGKLLLGAEAGGAGPEGAGAPVGVVCTPVGTGPAVTPVLATRAARIKVEIVDCMVEEKKLSRCRNVLTLTKGIRKYMTERK